MKRKPEPSMDAIMKLPVEAGGGGGGGGGPSMLPAGPRGLPVGSGAPGTPKSPIWGARYKNPVKDAFERWQQGDMPTPAFQNIARSHGYRVDLSNTAQANARNLGEPIRGTGPDGRPFEW